MDQVKLIEAIYCTKTRRGKGVEGDPIRVVTEVFTKEGELIAENDPEMIYTKKDMCNFAIFLASRNWVDTPAKNILDEWNKRNAG